MLKEGDKKAVGREGRRTEGGRRKRSFVKVSEKNILKVVTNVLSQKYIEEKNPVSSTNSLATKKIKQILALFNLPLVKVQVAAVPLFSWWMSPAILEQADAAGPMLAIVHAKSGNLQQGLISFSLGSLI